MEGGLGREATDKELSGGVICDGIGSSFAALFGVLPNTSFSQNAHSRNDSRNLTAVSCRRFMGIR